MTVQILRKLDFDCCMILNKHGICEICMLFQFLFYVVIGVVIEVQLEDVFCKIMYVMN